MNKGHFSGKIRNLSRKFFTKKIAVISAVVIASVFMITPLLTYASYAYDIDDRDRLMNRKNTGLILRDKNGEIFYKFGKINGEEDVKLDEVSDVFEDALLASEDKEFYNHEGYSLRGMAGALYANVLNKDPTRFGGSTITQQLVKNKLLTADKSFIRKYQEVAMAVAVERKYSKQEILEMYINSVYFGEGAFGVKEAAKAYFGKDPNDLNLAESSMLVGILPAPTAYSPVSGDKEKARQHQERVLNKMQEAGYISSAEKDVAEKEKLAYKPTNLVDQKHAQHFAQTVIEELKNKYGEETVIRSGYDVTTTLDLNWQKKAESIVQQKVKELSYAGARNAGLVAMDPKNGEIRVMVGSVDWENTSFGKVNMAISPRQPGSSFKPIFYTEAMNKRLITPATILEDKPKTYGSDNYAPTNYDFKYRGNIPVRNALALSLNIPAVDVMEKLGVSEATRTATRMGITTVNEPDKYGLSLALGTAEVKLSEMVHAYTGFANSGDQHEKTSITNIQDKYNRLIYSHNKGAAKQVTSPEASYLISSILSDNEARAPTFGSSLNIPDRKVAVKTGTTNDSKDAWTIGYTPSLSVGVWMGNNENKPMVGLAGSSSAGKVWKDSMSSFLEGTPAEDFKKPAGVTSMGICKSKGLKATGGGDNYEEMFIRGTEPTEECFQPKPVEQKEDKKPEQRKEREENEEEEDRGREGVQGGRGGGDIIEPTPEEPPVEEEPVEEPPPEESSDTTTQTTE